MPDNLPAMKIPVQPPQEVPDSEPEKVAPPNLGGDLEGGWEAELRNKAYWIREKENKLQKLEHELEVERVMLRQRRRYASALFGLSAIWLLFIGSYLILVGRGVIKTADSVLIALISTTTANVLGLFYIVARWLFPNKINNDKDRAKTD